MNDEQAFKAVFVKCRQDRDDVLFMFTVPAEKATLYLDRIGGFPKPGESRWCAIARINPTKEDNPPELHKTSSRQTLEKEPARPHNPYSRRAGIRPSEREFQLWVGTPECEDRYAYAASVIRARCKVPSRKNILPGTEAAELFDKMDREFIAWRDGPRHGAE